MSLIQRLSKLRKDFPYSVNFLPGEGQKPLYSFFGTYTPRIEDLKLNGEQNIILSNPPTKKGEVRFKINKNKEIEWYQL